MQVLSLAYSKTENATYLIVGTRKPTALMVDFHTGTERMGFTGMVSKGVAGEPHDMAIWDMLVDPSGRYLYTASKDTTVTLSTPSTAQPDRLCCQIKMWDLRSGFLVETFDGHQDGVRCISLHDNTLFSGSICIWIHFVR